MKHNVASFETPEFNTIVNRYKSDIEEYKKKITKLTEVENKNWENYWIPANDLYDKNLTMEIMDVYHLDSVNNTEETTKLVQELSEIYYSEVESFMLSNKGIYNSLLELKNNDYINLNEQEKQLLDTAIQDMELKGISLSDEEKEELTKINVELAQLSSEFQTNVIKSVQSFSLTVNEHDMEGVLDTDKELMKNEDGSYTITLKINDFIAYMSYGKNRKIRKKLMKAYRAKAPENREILERILLLRKQLANILGFNNYAELSLAKNKSAETTKDVVEMFKKFKKITKKQAKKDHKELESFAKEQDGIKKLKDHDVMYYVTKMEEQKYVIDKEKQKEYFEASKVLRGFFEFSQNIMQIKFKKLDNEPTWNKDVEVYDIYDIQEKYIGRIYYDLFARENKSEGAWMNNKSSYHIDKNQNTHYPIVYVVANFTPKNKDGKSFIDHDDVVTLFHEMGHALHHLLSKVPHEDLSGINGVKWDVVEFPSQFLEYFSFDKDVLKLFAKHHKTGEGFPQEEMDKIINARNFRSASQTLRQTQLGMIDFMLHLNTNETSDIDKIVKKVIQKTSIKKPKKKSTLINTFTHIFSGGYAAGYYSYKWAEILSADAYMEFQGKENQAEIFSKYKECILETGGYQNMMDKFKQFTGRSPEIESLLKIDGIIK